MCELTYIKIQKKKIFQIPVKRKQKKMSAGTTII